MGLKGDQGIRVQRMKAIAEAIEAGKPNGKVWVDHKKTYHVNNAQKENYSLIW